MTPNSRLRGGLHLPIGTVLALTITAAIAVAGAVFFVGWELLGARSLKPERQLAASTLFDLVKLAAGVVAGVGALVALVVAYRRQLVDEAGALREEEATLRDITRLHTERFTTAVSQLGDESAAVRLGGVHALASLADDAPTRDLRQTCINILCAYLRLPYTAESDLPQDDTGARHAYLSLRQVRHTVIRLIRDHLRLDADRAHSWRGHDFDFTSAVFDGADFSGAVFEGGTVQFDGARFEGGTVDFSGAKFDGGTFDFSGARFEGGTVDFSGAKFKSGTVDFSGAVFKGGTVYFSGARFEGGTIRFDAVFIGSDVRFDAEFAGSRVSFGGVLFHSGLVTFSLARFADGEVYFKQSRFHDGAVRFGGAVFDGATVDFLTAEGDIPDGLLPSNGQPLPAGLRLPPAWRQTP